MLQLNKKLYDEAHLDDYPENGILQFFVSADKWHDCEEIKILFHEHMEAPPQTDFPFLTREADIIYLKIINEKSVFVNTQRLLENF